MEHYPLVSIIINNYNYAQFLSKAIDSALAQTYKNIEVLVVDDGSIDNSQEIVEKYLPKVTLIAKENGGQGSACNLGFKKSSGDIVLFLDSDDILLPEIIEKVVGAFQSTPDVAKVQFRLQTVDEKGKYLQNLAPTQNWPMPSGDLRPQLTKDPNYIWPPTSGNAFSAEALEAILPMPEEPFRISADVYLNNLGVLFGKLISIDEAGGLYRLHGKNNAISFESLDIANHRNSIPRLREVNAKRKKLLTAINGVKKIDFESRDIHSLVGRTVSLKLEPENHPIDDNLVALCVKGFIQATFRSAGRKHINILLGLWFFAMLLSPKPLANQLANNLLYHQTRGKLVKRLRRVFQFIG